MSTEGSTKAPWPSRTQVRARRTRRRSNEGTSDRGSAPPFHEAAGGIDLGGLRREPRSGSIAARESKEATGVPEAVTSASTRGRQRPAIDRRTAEAEKRVVKTRHPPASLASRGPEPFGVRSDVLTTAGRRANERRASEHEAQASGRAGRRKSIPGAGSTRCMGARSKQVRSADVGSDAPLIATPLERREPLRGHARSSSNDSRLAR